MKDHPLIAPPKNGEEYHKIAGGKVDRCMCPGCTGG